MSAENPFENDEGNTTIEQVQNGLEFLSLALVRRCADLRRMGYETEAALAGDAWKNLRFVLGRLPYYRGLGPSCGWCGTREGTQLYAIKTHGEKSFQCGCQPCADKREVDTEGFIEVRA